MKVKFMSATTGRFTFGKVYQLKDIGDCFTGFDDNGVQFYSFDMSKLGNWEIVKK